MTFLRPRNDYVLRRGFTLDRVLLDAPPLKLGDARQKVLLLIRDPVDQMTSLWNYFIARGVYSGSQTIFQSDDDKLHLLTRYISLCFMYTSLRSSVTADGPTLIFDTKDITGKNAFNAARALASFLGVPYLPEVEKAFSVSYLSADDNAYWTYIQPYSLPVGPVDTFHHYQFFPAKMHDIICMLRDSTPRIIEKFEYEGEEYIISCDEKAFYSHENSALRKFWNKKRSQSLKDGMALILERKKLLNDLVKKYKMTRQDSIALLKRHPRFSKRLLRLLERELTLPIKEVPEKVEQWEHFRSLC